MSVSTEHVETLRLGRRGAHHGAMTTKQMEQWRERLEECLGEWVAITATRDHAPPALFEQTSFWGRVGGVRDEHVSIVNTDLTTDRIHLADIRTMRRT